MFAAELPRTSGRTQTMDRMTRRDTLKASAGLVAAGSAGVLASTPAMSAIPVANVAPPKQPVEAGAELRVIRPTKFVEPDEVVWNENSKRFTDTTGVKLRTDFVGWEDIRAQ